jgi:hypothetical protein
MCELETLVPAVVKTAWQSSFAAKKAAEAYRDSGHGLPEDDFQTGWLYAVMYITAKLGYRPGEIHEGLSPSDESTEVVAEMERLVQQVQSGQWRSGEFALPPVAP